MNSRKMQEIIAFLAFEGAPAPIPSRYETDLEKDNFVVLANNFTVDTRPSETPGAPPERMLLYRDVLGVEEFLVPSFDKFRKLVREIHGSHDQGIHQASMDEVYAGIKARGYCMPRLEEAIRARLETYCRHCYHSVNGMYLVDVPPPAEQHKQYLRNIFGLFHDIAAPIIRMSPVGTYHNITAEYETSVVNSLPKALTMAIGMFFIHN